MERDRTIVSGISNRPREDFEEALFPDDENPEVINIEKKTSK
jgi:hypothetical protein